MTSNVIRLYKNVFGSTKCPQVRGIDYFFTVLNFVCYSFIISVQVADGTIYHHGIKCVDIEIQVFYFASSCVSITSLIRIFFNRHKVRQVFEQLNDIDVEVGVYVNHTNLFKKQFRNL